MSDRAHAFSSAYFSDGSTVTMAEIRAHSIKAVEHIAMQIPNATTLPAAQQFPHRYDAPADTAVLIPTVELNMKLLSFRSYQQQLLESYLHIDVM